MVYQEDIVETSQNMEEIINKHRKEAVITCPENCWCWDWETKYIHNNLNGGKQDGRED